MVVNKVLETLNHCIRLSIKTDRVVDHSFGKVTYVTGNLNIVYILGKKVYVGRGRITENDNDIYYKLKYDAYNKRHIRYDAHPVFVTELMNDSEIEMFRKLLSLSREKWGNIRVSSSYAEYILNYIPYLLRVHNEYGYWDYEVRDITFNTDGKFIDVNLFIDNCDVEQFEDFLIPYSERVIDDLRDIGSFDEEHCNIWYDNPHLMKV